jgi:hypothetical protein
MVSFLSSYGSSDNRTAAPLAQATSLYSFARRLAGTHSSSGETEL